MDIFPHKVDWEAYAQACPLPEDWDFQASWLHCVDAGEWEDSHSQAVCAAEICNKLLPHVGEELLRPVGNVLVAVGGLDVDGWPGVNDDPNAGEIDYFFGAHPSPPAPCASSPANSARWI